MVEDAVFYGFPLSRRGLGRGAVRGPVGQPGPLSFPIFLPGYIRSMYVLYQGYSIRVPEPEVFVLLKLLILPRRKDQAKRMRLRNSLPFLVRERKLLRRIYISFK